jgi:lysozyme family protein
MAWTYENTKAGYAKLWNSLVIKDKAGADKFAKKIIAAEPRYRKIQDATGVPWYFVGLLHMRESSNDFRGVLHNGEKIIGTKKVTSLVPAGRGPFRSWEEAAIDALKLKGLQKIKDWPVERVAYEAERYNGLGYTRASIGINSPYLWAGSNHQQRGKFVSDGKFDPNAVDTQMGVMTVLKRIHEIQGNKAGGLAAGGAVIAGGTAAAASGDWSVALFVIGAAIITATIAYIIISRRKK